MRIALICTEKLPVPPVAGGAIQLYIDGIVPHLSVRHDINVYCIQYPGLPDEEIAGNVKYVRVQGKTGSVYLDNLKERLDSSYDLVHVFNRPHYLLALSESYPGVKFSLSLHNEMFHPEKISDESGLKCIERAEFINTVSRYIASSVVSRLPFAENKVRVVYSGVDPVKYHPGWTDEGSKIKYRMKAKYGLHDYRVILFVGRLSAKKGAHIFIRAMEKVMSMYKDTAAVVVGSKWYGKNDSDDYTKSLMALSQNLSGPIVFTGFIPPSEVADFFSMADIFVCASQWNEPLARVHYEAMAAGLPIITTNRGGNREVVDGYGNGIVIDEYNNPDALAGHISYLLDNPDAAFEMGKAGRKLAETKFNWARVAAEVFKMFETGVRRQNADAARTDIPEAAVIGKPEAAGISGLEAVGTGGPEAAGAGGHEAAGIGGPGTAGEDGAYSVNSEGAGTVTSMDMNASGPESMNASGPDSAKFTGLDGVNVPWPDGTGISESKSSDASGASDLNAFDAKVCGFDISNGGNSPLNISIIGTGYVGLVTGACLASAGMNVCCCDCNEEKIANLKKGIMPIYEPCLEFLVENCAKRHKRLRFTTNINEAVDHGDVIFITVNTPTLGDNTCDTTRVFEVAREIALHMNSYKVIVNKSTVPVGTGQRVKNVIRDTLLERNARMEFDVASNPEFLREGSAVEDFINPDRIVIGIESERSLNLMKSVYREHINNNIPILVTTIEEAEMIKYASNAFLAARLSFINEIANICELCNIDINAVTSGMSLDKRIGRHFLNPGPGFGGSCFPKDVMALIGLGREHGYVPRLMESVIEVNNLQKKRMVQKIKSALGKLNERRISLLGLAFKPGTDDIRESPSMTIIPALLKENAIVSVYDPQAMQNMKSEHPEMKLEYCTDAYSACELSDCIVLLTDWEEFGDLDFNRLKSIVKNPVFLDLRNVYEPDYVKSFGFYYEGVGRK